MMREQCNSSRLIFKSDIGTWDNSLGWETNSHGWEPRKQSNHSQLNFVFQTILMVGSFVWCMHYLSGVHECHASVIRMMNNGDPDLCQIPAFYPRSLPLPAHASP